MGRRHTARSDPLLALLSLKLAPMAGSKALPSVPTLLLLAAVSFAFIQAASARIPRSERFEPVVIGDLNAVEFQITVKVNGETRYLYAEGDKVLATPDPRSVGTRRTVWEARPETTGAVNFALLNVDSGSYLFYDSEREHFYVERTQGPLRFANWRLLQSQEDARRFKLQVVPGLEYAKWRESDEPEIFYIINDVNVPFIHGQAASSGKSERFELVKVGEANLGEIRIAVKVDGEKQYLYAEDEKILATPDLLSVGRRAVWQVKVDSPSDYNFALQNVEAGSYLLYDAEKEQFYWYWLQRGLKAPFANWRLLQSVDDSRRYKLQVIDAGGEVYAKWSESDEPQIFYISSSPRPHYRLRAQHL